MLTSDLPCFQQFNFKKFKTRFMQNSTDQDCETMIEKLIYDS